MMCGETIGIQDHLVERCVLASRGGPILQNLSEVAQTKTTSSFLSDGELIAGNHLDLNTESPRMASSSMSALRLSSISSILSWLQNSMVIPDILFVTLEPAGGLFMVGNLGVLIDGVERLEVEDLDTSVSLGWVGDKASGADVGNVLVLGASCPAEGC
jgi:hypothetical protein